MYFFTTNIPSYYFGTSYTNSTIFRYAEIFIPKKFNNKKFVKKNITSSKNLYLLKMKMKKLINYLIDMCQSCQGMIGVDGCGRDLWYRCEGKLFMTNEIC